MDRETTYIIIDHFKSKTEKERQQNVLNFIVRYINEQINMDEPNQLSEEVR